MQRFVPGPVLAVALALVLVSVALPGLAGEDAAADRATVCVDPDWPPYEVIDGQGRHQGIAADLLRLAAARVGLALDLVPTRDWEDSIAASKDGRCQMLSFLNQTPKRDEWLVFTDPIFVDANVIVTREEHRFVADLAAVSGETMVLPRGTSIEERVRRDFPDLAIVTTDSEADAFAMVANRKADMTLRALTVAVDTIKKEGWFNLKVAGQVPGYENRLRVGVRKDAAALRDRLNAGIATITAAERGAIENQHVAINVQTGIDYGLVWRVAGLFSVVLVTSLFWAFKLKGANERLRVLSRTDSLTGLANRAELNRCFDAEVDRARRYGRPLSVILLDLDHFKRVNDDLGHLAGDRVLVAFADVVRATVRGSDTVGRWGGEEFLVLCPETDGEQARVLADRIGAATRRHPFATGLAHTVSGGVATLRGGDSVDSLLHRADEALYRAKSGGRDQACAL